MNLIKKQLTYLKKNFEGIKIPKEFYYTNDVEGYPKREVSGFFTQDELQLEIDRRKSRKPLYHIEIDDNITNDQIMKEIKKSAGRLLTNIELFDIYKGENIDANKKSLAYKLTFNDKDNTLTDEVINPIFNKIMEDIKNKFNCEIRDK